MITRGPTADEKEGSGPLFEWSVGHACALPPYILSGGLTEISARCTQLSPSVLLTVYGAAVRRCGHHSIQTGDSGPPFS